VEPKDFVLRSQEILIEKCPKCFNQTLKISSIQKYLDALIDLAENLHINIELISSETEEGEILKNAFGGVAAFLKTSFY
jgi:peptide subunit release factor 1 (eRF1)